MISFNFCLFVQHNDFKIELQVFCIFLVLEISDDFFRLNEVDVDYFEEIHTDFRFLFQYPV